MRLFGRSHPNRATVRKVLASNDKGVRANDLLCYIKIIGRSPVEAEYE